MKLPSLKNMTSAVESTVKHPVQSITKHPLKTAMVVLGAYVAVDYLVSHKGTSVAEKALNAVHPKKLAAAVSGSFGPGWGRGNMPLMYGGHWAQTPAGISAGHNAWEAAAGHPTGYYNQSSYPWA